MHEAIEEIKVVRLELHEELLKIPQYRALVALDDLLRSLEHLLPPVVKPEPEPIQELTHIEQQPVQAETVPIESPPAVAAAPIIPIKKKLSKPLTQVQALLHILRKKGSPAGLGWIMAELELLGVKVGGANPRKTIGVALSGNKDLFRRVVYDDKWLWGLEGSKYPGETTYDHLPPTTFKSMRVKK